MLAETQQHCLFFFVWEPGNDKQTIYFEFAIKIRHKSISRDNGKIIRKEMSKLFYADYVFTHYGMVKWRQNVNFEEIDTEPSTRKKWWILITKRNI